MRVVIVGLGVQGRKRLAVAGSEVIATVDPVYKTGEGYTRVLVAPPVHHQYKQ
jgi:diphthamide biosynthesis methyltransferase